MINLFCEEILSDILFIAAHSSEHFEKPIHGNCLFFIELKSLLINILLPDITIAF